jgi:hypothetical protein
MPEGNFAAAQQQSKKSSGGWDDFDYLKLKDGEAAVVRFLCNESPTGDHPGFLWAYCHETVPRGKAKWGDDEPCLDRNGDGSVACPGCEAGRDRYFLGYMILIWRDGPVYGTTENKVGDKVYVNKDYDKVVGRADGIFIWSRGIREFTEFAGKDATYRGLMTRDFTIKRTGKGADDTKYHIEPYVDADGNSTASPMSDADKALWAKWLEEGNLDKVKAKVTPQSYAEARKLFNPAGQQPDDNAGASDPPADSDTPKNVFDAVPDVSAFAQKK